jgi:hypothetical protein
MASTLNYFDCPLCRQATRFISVKQACEIIEVNRRTLYRYMEEGKLGYRQRPSGRGRFVCHDCLLKLPEALQEEDEP